MTARGNGLRASAYAVLIEIEESLGDRLLSALAERQIAAYVVPAQGPGASTRLILHVDAQRRVPAGIVLAGLTPALAGELPADSEQAPEPAPSAGAAGTEQAASAESMADDAAFAELVADFHRTPAERTWPDAEDLPDEPPSATPPTIRPVPPIPPTSLRPSRPAQPAPEILPFDPKSGVDRRRPPGSARARPPVPPVPPVPPMSKRSTELPGDAAEGDLDDPDDHYLPPTLPKLTPSPVPVRLALAGLMIGLAMLLFPTLIAVDHQTGLDIIGVFFVLGSTGVLLSRLHDRSPDDPDDGAVV